MDTKNVIDSVEALSWLEQSDGKDRTVGENHDTCLRTEEALQLVRELYAAGATEVQAQIVVIEYEFEDACSLTVILPKEEGKRSSLFDIEKRALHEMGSSFAPEGEQGQDFFMLGW